MLKITISLNPIAVFFLLATPFLAAFASLGYALLSKNLPSQKRWHKFASAFAMFCCYFEVITTFVAISVLHYTGA
ncbi:MAG: hypothetical protein ACOX3T_02880 [Bdellovibrionota bacterium]